MRLAVAHVDRSVDLEYDDIEKILVPPDGGHRVFRLGFIEFEIHRGSHQLGQNDTDPLGARLECLRCDGSLSMNQIPGKNQREGHE